MEVSSVAWWWRQRAGTHETVNTGIRTFRELLIEYWRSQDSREGWLFTQ